MEDLKELLITTRRKKLQAEDAAKNTVYDSDHYRQEGAAEVYAEFEDKLSAIINKSSVDANKSRIFRIFEKLFRKISGWTQ
jgi:hypothetical protein